MGESPTSLVITALAGINKADSLLRLLRLNESEYSPRTSIIGRPARGYSVSPPCNLTMRRRPSARDRCSFFYTFFEQVFFLPTYLTDTGT